MFLARKERKSQFAYSALFFVVMRSRGDAAGFGGHGIEVVVVKSANAALSTPVGLSILLRTNIDLNRNEFSGGPSS